MAVLEINLWVSGFLASDTTRPYKETKDDLVQTRKRNRFAQFLPQLFLQNQAGKTVEGISSIRIRTCGLKQVGIIAKIIHFDTRKSVSKRRGRSADAYRDENLIR